MICLSFPAWTQEEEAAGQATDTEKTKSADAATGTGEGDEVDDSDLDGDVTSWITARVDHDTSSYEYASVASQNIKVINEDDEDSDMFSLLFFNILFLLLK